MAPPPTPPDIPPLERTLTRQAQQAITDSTIRAREQAAKAQADSEHFKSVAAEALDALDLAAAQFEQQKILAAAACGGVVVFCSVLGGAAGMAFARRSQAATLAHVSQEMVDLRRRGASELAKAERFAAFKLAKDLVPALDAMDALVADAAPGSATAEGANLTRRTLRDALASHGVSRVEPAIGEPFDVAVMEAMLTVPSADPATTGTVQTVLRPGYVLHGGERVLRAAQVGVGAALD